LYIHDWSIDFWCFNATFNNISATCTSWRPVLVVEEAWSTWREPPTMGKQLVNFITCGCESSAPFFVIYAVLVIGLYELLGNLTTLTHWATRTPCTYMYVSQPTYMILLKIYHQDSNYYYFKNFYLISNYTFLYIWKK
jgi:hypothetical protein